ncbi:carbohydrate-binding protein SusD [Niastella koreensis]|uniref:RagB/SusD domain-containing protein n=2 Tax=Niastella koreensis TaxID=354356 RepID=G8TBL1_NIAKG|nr:RagB/SusD family nutrient uptake outer membrane protein [Niastella koreensis]AEV97121.1 RagB/SusD domain-containing protein [Niastella koreensis GR20-10]OQP39192.1 carbohydrate-binding protein SusD [Niastella koreensis]
MKRLSYIILLASITGISSCSKNLDQQPVSDVVTSTFFKTVSDFTQGVNGAYSKLKAIPLNLMWMDEVRSDNTAITTDGNRDFQGINDFSPNLTTTAFIVNSWQNGFNGIFNVNTVLDAIQAKGAGVLTSDLATRFTAELRFLRGFYYFDLLKHYGALPIIDKSMTPAEAGAVKRSSLADVYSFIISDFEFAAANLPEVFTGADLGRPTLYSAKGMLGLVYMTRSGPALVNGPGLNTNEWNKAYGYFDDIIKSNKYSFLTDFASIFSYTNENNKEVVFDIQYATTSSGGEFPSQLVPDTYWSGLNFSGYGNGYGSASYNVSKNLLQSYRNSVYLSTGTVDKRDTFSIKHAYPTNSSTPAVLDTSRPFIKKYLNPALKGKDRADWPINFIVLRYTDVLMMKAECILHGAPGTQADVDAIVKQVRDRAGVGTPALANVTLPTLMEERRREFLGEGIRWNDLVRENMFVTTMNAWRVSDTLTSTIQEVKPEYSVYPVPQAEILAKPGLYDQNQGYY